MLLFPLRNGWPQADQDLTVSRVIAILKKGLTIPRSKRIPPKLNDALKGASSKNSNDHIGRIFLVAEL